MRNVEDIIKQAKELPVTDRRRLIEELEHLDEPIGEKASGGPYDALLELAGTAHAHASDVARNKNQHLSDIHAGKRKAK